MVVWWCGLVYRLLLWSCLVTALWLAIQLNILLHRRDPWSL